MLSRGSFFLKNKNLSLFCIYLENLDPVSHVSWTLYNSGNVAKLVGGFSGSGGVQLPANFPLLAGPIVPNPDAPGNGLSETDTSSNTAS